MKKISIILPIYKYTDCIIESINSILNQTYKNIELIIIIEKTKDSKKIAQIIKEKINDEKIKIHINKTKLGLAESLNYGLNISTGEYIARMDADDISLPNRLKIQYEYMEKYKNVDILATNSEYFGDVEGPWFSDKFTFDRLKANLLISNPVCHPTVMFRKKSIEKYDLKYNPEFISEDFELWCEAISKGCIINMINDVTLKYRKNSENMTSDTNLVERRIESVVLTMKKYYKSTLNLTLSTKQIMNLQILFNYKKNKLLRYLLIKKIVKRNRKVNYFNDEDLTFVLGYKSVIKKIISHIRK